jgi:hypothetical protein
MAAIYPVQRDTGEDYPSVLDILRMDDLAECDIVVPLWQTPDKKRTIIRVRALSLKAQEAIVRASRIAAAKIAKAEQDDNPPDQDVETYLIETWVHGVIAPTFDRQQAQTLRNRNGHAIQSVATFIWALSSLDRQYIDRLITELTQPVAPPDDDQTAPAE